MDISVTEFKQLPRDHSPGREVRQARHVESLPFPAPRDGMAWATENMGWTNEPR